MCLKVVIIESPSPDNLFDGVSEGQVLSQSLNLCQIPVQLRLVVNLETLIRCFREDVIPLTLNVGCVPILHFSGHGNDKGFQLTDRNFISWQDLFVVFQQINHNASGKMIVCLSCCEGYSASVWTLVDGAPPVDALVGHTGKPRWEEAAIAFCSFYHLLKAGRSVKEAVDGMNAAAGITEFRVIQGSDIIRLKEQAAPLGGIEAAIAAIVQKFGK